MIPARRNHTLTWHFDACQNLALALDRLEPEKDEEGHVAHDNSIGRRVNFVLNSNVIDAYTTAFEAWKSAWTGFEDTILHELTCTTPMMVGTGNANLNEVGTQLLKPWGIPYLTGSAVKGALSGWLAKRGGEDWTKGHTHKSEYQTELFGGMYEDESWIGSLVFGDAWLDPSSASMTWFQPDIITPHQKSYYKGENFPDGMDSPEPHKTVALTPDLMFILPIRMQSAQKPFIYAALSDMLEFGGLGAKTAVGYGRVSLHESRYNQEAEKQRLQKKQERKRIEEEHKRIEAEKEAEAQAAQHKQQVLDHGLTPALNAQTPLELASTVQEFYKTRKKAINKGEYTGSDSSLTDKEVNQVYQKIEWFFGNGDDAERAEWLKKPKKSKFWKPMSGALNGVAGIERLQKKLRER